MTVLDNYDDVLTMAGGADDTPYLCHAPLLMTVFDSYDGVPTWAG